jgi:DNA mismatch endonuclease (patch repair protein)
MSKVHSFNTKPELIVRQYLFSQGFRYRINKKNLPGKPDIVINKYNTIVLIHGCFWHAHKNCRRFIFPKTNIAYWKQKIEKNINRDEQNTCALKKLGWNVIVVWTCQLKGSIVNRTLANLKKQILK